MRPISKTWVWTFDHPPEAVWPLLADTARINEVTGLGKHEVEEIPQPDGSVRYLARMRKRPFTIRWEEQPVNWVNERHHIHVRNFFNGPFQRLTAGLDLVSEGDGCRVDYTVEILPRRGFGWLLRAGKVMSSIGKKYEPLVASARRHLEGARETPFDFAPPPVSPEDRARSYDVAAQIENSPHGHGVARRLVDWLLSAPEADLFRIRPLALARSWKEDERAVTECCLQGVKDGLLFLRWDLMCPNCRGAKQTSGTLDALPDGAHCPTCNIDYGRDFSRNVELTFHPSPKVRDVIDGEYCFFAPGTTPHVKIQQTLKPGERRVLDAPLADGPYRVRLLHGDGEVAVDLTQEGFPEISVDEGAVSAGVPASRGEVVIHNRLARGVTVTVEAREWERDALIADRVTNLQAFRDLFSEDVLRPGDEVAVRRVTLMFTDLKGSTAMYGRIGDAAAYGLVRDHFAYLAQAVRDNNGAIVKTIGDAVMAAFADPGDAVRAAAEVQRGIGELNRRAGAEALVLKVGLHAGPCIAVTLNDRLDYFGSTVNMAARLQGESTGGDIVLSEDVANDTSVAPMLAELNPTSEAARIKGFDAPVDFLRIVVDHASESVRDVG